MAEELEQPEWPFPWLAPESKPAEACAGRDLGQHGSEGSLVLLDEIRAEVQVEGEELDLILQEDSAGEDPESSKTDVESGASEARVAI